MAKKVKVVQCPHCGELNPKGMKVCKNCGESLVEPIYKRKWFIALIIVIVLALCGSIFGGGSSSDSSNNSNSGSDTQEVEKIEYTKYNCTDLFDELKANAMKAEKNHQDEYVEVTGYLSNIDSDGKYISIGASKNDYDYLFQTISCDFSGNNKEQQKDVVMEMNTDDKITVKGKITSIGEVLGYRIDIDEVIAK